MTGKSADPNAVDREATTAALEGEAQGMSAQPADPDRGRAERAVAIALFIESDDGKDEGELFDAQPEEERLAMLEMARTATTAHLEWLAAAGFMIAPSRTMLRPKTEAEAEAMIMAAQQFLEAASEGAKRRASPR